MKRMKNIYLFIIFGILFLCSISFLFGEGYYSYLDASAELVPNKDYLSGIISSLSTIDKSTYFGYDNGILGGVRYILWIFSDGLKYIFGHSIGVLIFYSIFFISSFGVSFIIFRRVFSKKLSFIGALIFTFNPISYYFLSQPGFLYSYFSGPLILLGCLYVYEKKSIGISVLFLYIGILLLFSYPRLVGIYFVFFLFLLLFYIKDIFGFISKNIFRIFTIVFLLLLLFLPFLLKFHYSYVVEKDYFQGVGNYAIQHSSHAEYLYNHIKSTGFLKSFSIAEITNNFQYSLHSTPFYTLFSTFFILYFIFLGFLLPKKGKHKKLFFMFFGMYILIIFLKSLPYFVDIDVFQAIYYKFFPFIANNNGWLDVLSICCLAFFIVYVFLYSFKYILYFNLTLLFIFFLVNGSVFFNNPLLQKVQNYPQEYKKIFAINTNNKEASFFSQGYGLYTNWSPYPINIRGGSEKYLDTFSDNIRIISGKQQQLYQMFNSGFNIYSVIFNVKNIFISKDLKNPKHGQFAFFPIKDYVLSSQNLYDKMIKNINLYIKEENEKFIFFGVKHSSKYEFFLYAPRTIGRYNLQDFFSNKNTLDILEKPINIDNQSFNKPDEINILENIDENKNIKIQYKRSNSHPGKIYLALENIDSYSPFLVQLNQTFGMSWKLKWITKKEFNKKKCIDKYKDFPITQNSYCYYKENLVGLGDIQYIFYNQVKDKNHFEGNFVGNTWLIESDDIPQRMKKQEKLYAVIIYEKQILYNIALIISFITTIGLIIGVLIPVVKQKRMTKNK